MIRPSDAFTLAFTKFKTRKVRTIVTATIASLLFSVLVMAVLVISGIISSARDFTAGGLTERYITSVLSMDDVSYGGSTEVMARAKTIHKQLTIDKAAEAKRLGLDYDPSQEPEPVVDMGNGERYLDENSVAAKQALAEEIKSQPSSFDKIKDLAAPYDPKAVYETQYSQINGQANLMTADGESFNYSDDTGFDPAKGSGLGEGWVYMDQSVTKPFMLSQDQLAEQSNREAIPVIAPYRQVEEALGLKDLPKDASRQDQLQRIKEVRSKAHQVEYQLCYRNSASIDSIEQAKQLKNEISKNQNNPDYIKPSVVYELPTPDSCGAVSIASDSRSAQEKDYDEKLKQLEYKFNPEAEPAQQKVDFRVVGIAPAGPDFESFSTVDGLVQMVAGSSLQGLWVIPNQLYEQLPNKSDYEKFRQVSGSSYGFQNYAMSSAGHLVEFSSVEEAKQFRETAGCSGWDCGSGKPLIQYFGSNSALIDEIMDGATSVLQVAGLVIAGIASIIMLGMVGRVIADSRRETAVFRAIGARRSDINVVYVIYTVMFSLFIALIAIIIGTLLAGWLDISWSDQATVSAQLAFSGAKDDMTFRLINFWPTAIVAVVGLILAAGLLSLLIPLVRNVRRSPLKDMRDDQ